MEFNLKKDLIFFDIESTGLNVIKDKIIQIALIKYFADGSEPEELALLINPAMLISKEAYEVHGISAQDVANKPTFNLIANDLFNFIGDSDLGGYNLLKFDIPILMEEFGRVGLDFSMDNRKIVDAQRIFYKMEPRTLTAAYKYYTGEKFEGAHDALEDVKATIAVLKGQLKMYEGIDFEDRDNNITKNPVRNDMEALDAFSNDFKTVDATMRFKYNESGVIVFNFGKYKGQPAGQTLFNDKNMYNWILNKEFSIQVKNLVKKLYKEHEDSLAS